ncbi:MAG: type I-E CRISPR-associated protein Cas7/Cse4/CasC [Oscillibacter sp.]|nr:type I-E CRISPR-associated protein Cas7/Cse4/CasC [Oscillibacter sp.]
MKANLYLDFHVLQTVPPSCVNRDDTGSPKTAVYGGVTRARVSSQAWKHEMRVMFRNLLEPEQCGIRTKHLPEELAKRISALDRTANADELAKAVLSLLGIGIDSKDENKTKVLLFVSQKQLDALAEFAVKNGRDAKALERRIAEVSPGINAHKVTKAVLKESGIIVGKDGDAVFLASQDQFDAMVRQAELVDIGDKGTKKKSKKSDKASTNMQEDCVEALSANPSVDIALFGRMLAEVEELRHNAAAQVAHSISTHAVHNEYDYFTAVDDIPEKGAAYLDTTEFNSSTLYRYATVSVRELADYLGADTPAAVRCFAEAFIRSMPTGRQHPFANRTMPDFVYVALRRDQPVNLCGAFEKPITAGKGGYVEPSVKALAQYAEEKVYKPFDLAPECAWTVSGYTIPKECTEFAKSKAVSLTAFLADVESYVENALDSGVI